ncbi:MAG TPA: cache domain-containing protein [Spirochaetota bacterium]|nr:cache domain-containing protein [Spirochaetota bacterium]HPC42049.1 cache domain-containing protein [Spirochaetota bacterium]HPL18165.1 cache domain-containing protein [Spirochaetota bacterium]HQF09565.1 cache domain-containing protein [Spirochaetota bacterium]HQH98365.1 cache domain-containing protein [Spirochaetota bacterium]
MKARFRAKISTKLVISLMSVVAISGFSSVFLGLNVINNNVVGQAYEEVRSHLNTARYFYNERIKIIYLFINHLSSLEYLQNAILYNDRPLLIEKLLKVKKELNVDIMTITDASGRVIARANNPQSFGDDESGDAFVKYVLEKRKPCSGTDIVTREQLLRESKDLADRAYIRVVPTLRARPKDRIYETKGMCKKAAAPIFSGDRLIGVIYGAKLLNNNFDMVNSLKNLLFKDERIGSHEIGTVTLFMDDLRISTNVKDSSGKRAVGTQISEEVYSKVFELGKVWLDKAFVVDSWYLSGYSPIYDINRRVVGILYVGILEEKYNQIQRNATMFTLLVILITGCVAAVLSIYLIRGIITPIKRLVSASQQLAEGNYIQKISITSSDEMGYLCTTFNRMVDAISERDRKLKEQTEMQMAQSEKLASLGRLASGIAHEINNPLTGVLSYSTVLYEEIKDPGYRADLKVIIDETIRCRDIVKGILDFARETRIDKRPGNLNRIINELLTILEKHVNFQNIRIKKDLAENLPEINIDVNQIKSVFNNLAVNAADAMHNGGDLAIRTRYDESERKIVVTVSDTGTGIKKENLSKIYDPFFTTKETGKGTGLGLSVTYSIVQRHNGTIRVDSVEGKGTTFTIEFPVDTGDNTTGSKSMITV